MTTMKISDLSLTGCYIDTRMSARIGAAITIRLVLAGIPLTGSGHVIHAQSGIGFGIRFDPPSEATVERLSAFLRPPPLP